MTEDLREKIARQLALEDESRSLGAERYRSQRPLPWRDDTASTTEEGELPPGRQLIRQVVPPVAQAVTEFTERVAEGGAGRRPAAFKMLAFVDPEAAAYLAARVVVNGAVFGHAVQTVASEVAEALVHHIEMGQLKDANKKGYKGLLKAQEKAGFSSKKRAALKKIMDKEGTLPALIQSGVPARGDKPKGLLLFPYSGSFLWYRWKIIVADLQKSGYDLSDAVLHSFRHTCLTRLSERGLPIEKVADWAGHSDISITMKHYRHAEASSLDIGASLLA